VINALKAIHTAESNFKAKSGSYGTLEQLAAERVLDKKYASATQSGYALELIITGDKPAPNASFAVQATPQSYGVSGRRSFYIDHTGVLHGADNEGGAAAASDPAIEK
jgi:hypothetical protein